MIKVIDRDKLIIRKSMTMAFAGGEIWFEQLDALSVYKDVVTEKFLADMKDIRRPSSPSRIAVNINETLVDDEIADMLVDNLCKADKFITKLVFVGTDHAVKKLLKKKLKSYDYSFSVNFINDYEKAKNWLMTEEY